MFKYSWMGVVVFTTIGRKSTWCKSRSRTYSWLKFYSCYAGNGNEYKLWSIFTSSFVVCPGSYSRDVPGVKRIWPPEGNIPLPWIKLEISLGFEHWISNFTKMVWKSVLQILHQHTLASRTPCPGWTTQPWLVHSVQVFSQSLLTGISIPGNKPALFFMLGPIGDIDMNPRSLHVNYCWIMWPLCLISITHTHTNTHTHTHTHTHTFANTQRYLCQIQIAKPFVLSCNDHAVCVSNVTRLAGRTVDECVCVCVCVAESKWLSWHTYTIAGMKQRQR